MKKNIPLLKRLRTRFLRMRHAEHFDMRTLGEKTECGSVFCIGGHVLDLMGYKLRKRTCGAGCCVSWDFVAPNGAVLSEPLRTAAQKLGMGWAGEAHDLFYDYSIKTPKQAAKRIEQIIAEAEA